MSTKPLSVEAFDAMFPDEDTAEAFLVSLRWPDGVCCPKCGSRDMRRLSTRRLWQCRAPCRAQTSVRSGTALHRSKVSLRDCLFIAMRCSTFSGAATRAIARERGLRQDTVFGLVHKVRAALAERGGWRLEGEFALGAVDIPVPKAANGDPPEKPPFRVAVAIDPAHQPPDAIRFEVASAPEPPLSAGVATDDAPPPDEALLAEARYRHIHPAAIPVEIGERTFLGMARRRVVVWLTQRFGGVSRRYLNNYLAQFAYTQNRAHRASEMFLHIVRRLTHEPWRPRSDVALATP